MRFVIAKKNNIRCFGCEAEIMRGEEMVLTFYRRPGIARPGMLTFHAGCHLGWYEEKYNRKWIEWRNGTGCVLRPKLGRPPACDHPTKEQYLNRLRAARSYHRRQGHTDKAGIFDTMISKLLGITVPIQDSTVIKLLDISTPSQ